MSWNWHSILRLNAFKLEQERHDMNKSGVKVRSSTKSTKGRRAGLYLLLSVEGTLNNSLSNCPKQHTFESQHLSID